MQPFQSIIDYLAHSCIHHKERPALFCQEPAGEASHTYASLSQRVALITNLLLAKDHSPSRIVIFLDKCLTYVEAIYGTLATGAAYIPLDATQPAERVDLILQEAMPDIVITTQACQIELEHRFSRPLPFRVLTVETIEQVANDLTETLQLPELPVKKAEDIAIILFTSGSTGVPKGVRISHGNLTFFIDWACDELSVTKTDILANHAPFAFDLSTFDLFAALKTGAATWIITAPEQKNAGALIAGIEKIQPTIWYSVPSVLNLLTATLKLHPENTKSLRHVIFAGEPFAMKPLRVLSDCLPKGCILNNWYGPTETNVCFSYQVTASCLENATTLPIGLPLPGLDALLENTERDTDTGRTIGELIVYGPCVTPGYMNHKNPAIEKRHAERQHATGDLVYQEDGLFYYSGRIDDMVKIHGNRVELGEIEACLLQLPNVKAACVIYTEDSDQPGIVAHLTLTDTNSSLNILTVKQHVSKRLPKYMIPHRLHILDALPLNPNGKVDRKKLKKAAQASSK